CRSGLLRANSREVLERLRRTEPGDHVAGDGGAADLFRIILAPRRPYPCFAALDGQLAADRKAMLDVKARAAEFPDARGHVPNVAELDRPEEIGAGIDQWNSDNAERVRQLVRFDPERRLEHLPGAGIEDLEETAVEHDPCRIALAPLDGQFPAIDERRHALPPPALLIKRGWVAVNGVNGNAVGDRIFTFHSRASGDPAFMKDLMCRSGSPRARDEPIMRNARRLYYCRVLCELFTFRFFFRGSGHSNTCCDNNSTREERRRLRSACRGAAGTGGEVSRSTSSPSRSSDAITQLRGAERG